MCTKIDILSWKKNHVDGFGVCVCFWVSVGRGGGAMRETMLVFRGIPNEPR